MAPDRVLHFITLARMAPDRVLHFITIARMAPVRVLHFNQDNQLHWKSLSIYGLIFPENSLRKRTFNRLNAASGMFSTVSSR